KIYDRHRGVRRDGDRSITSWIRLFVIILLVKKDVTMHSHPQPERLPPLSHFAGLEPVHCGICHLCATRWLQAVV
ncbi:hypothetical protein, partial [Trichocoleus sp. FACHB-262]|uniref:hypothetical protein n=1 Tax=Trichocoleus sp. FACHB-262 TaxID=2692869 RepID=UPI001A7E6746